ncbi:hypothetical protein B0T26DRAFT_335583 [Lasiosphaeria miniovina]|uniref:Uncharacterized protein n=1 Tax=Lasiosphaeria miniovina TaxID=1954250 RepID=A0AA40DUJ7_9PEZI|nr:uncharacterized protein B0T26DRAFT_335583 [Lasiosphaeria miniovina]KAK0712353.1 hypothetical protein B0T26DRAFT_335583 [Lasiosphaeria miniovina]
MKPGLKKAQKMKRLEFVMQVRNWTLEGWKKVVWSDETSVALGATRGKRRKDLAPCVGKELPQLHLPSLERLYGLYILGLLYLGEERSLLLLAKESAKMKEKYKDMMGVYNEKHESEDYAQWKAETELRRFNFSDKKKPGRKPSWKYTKATGKQEGDLKGGIDWSSQWRTYPQEKLRRFVERIPGHIEG